MPEIVPISYHIQGLADHTLPFTVTDGRRLLRKVEHIARVSHRSEDAVTPDSYDRLLRSVVLNHGDWSVTEHAIVTVEVEVDRGITHEIVRHRIGAYTQESTRFVNYAKKLMRFIMPKFKHPDSVADYREAAREAEERYMRFIERGEPPELARSILPTGLASKLVMTYNLRTWRHFFIMRATKNAHPQMRELTDPLLAEFQKLIPILYEDIEPGQSQAQTMRLLR